MRRYRAIASLCRQAAAFRPARKFSLLQQADDSRCTGPSHFQVNGRRADGEIARETQKSRQAGFDPRFEVSAHRLRSIEAASLRKRFPHASSRSTFLRSIYPPRAPVIFRIKERTGSFDPGFSSVARANMQTATRGYSISARVSGDRRR